MNQFGLEEKAMDRAYTLAVVEETHAFWQKLVDSGKKESQDEFRTRLWADINDFTSSKLLEQRDEITSTVDEQRNRIHVTWT